MHPILSSKNNVLLYLLAWVTLGSMLGFQLNTSGHLTNSETICVTLPVVVTLAAPRSYTCLEAAGQSRLGRHLLWRHRTHRGTHNGRRMQPYVFPAPPPHTPRRARSRWNVRAALSFIHRASLRPARHRVIPPVRTVVA